MIVSPRLLGEEAEQKFWKLRGKNKLDKVNWQILNQILQIVDYFVFKLYQGINT